jgi:hypothetical protein
MTVDTALMGNVHARDYDRDDDYTSRRPRDAVSAAVSCSRHRRLAVDRIGPRVPATAGVHRHLVALGIWGGPTR